MCVQGDQGSDGPLIVLDECHKAKNLLQPGKNKNMTLTGFAVRLLQEQVNPSCLPSFFSTTLHANLRGEFASFPTITQAFDRFARSTCPTCCRQNLGPATLFSVHCCAACNHGGSADCIQIAHCPSRRGKGVRLHVAVCVPSCFCRPCTKCFVILVFCYVGVSCRCPSPSAARYTLHADSLGVS